jgi:hypothetical protein
MYQASPPACCSRFYQSSTPVLFSNRAVVAPHGEGTA